MRVHLVLITLAFSFCLTGPIFGQSCGKPQREELSLNLWSTRSLTSPDTQWRFTSVGPHSSDRNAALYIQNIDTRRKWQVGTIERNGTVFWSEDSKRLFLRDEFAADDTKIRVFDLTGPVPKEIVGLDRKIREAVFFQIPKNKTTLWLYYPEACFIPGDSSTIDLLADAPLVLKGQESRGQPFRVRLTLSLLPLRVLATKPEPNPD
jgi:hypothetical protein